MDWLPAYKKKIKNLEKQQRAALNQKILDEAKQKYLSQKKQQLEHLKSAIYELEIEISGLENV